MKNIFLIIFTGFILIGDCSFAPNKKAGKNEPITGIWQLDYYPDSIFIHRSINDCSEWTSDYAYNIQFEGDSCHFYGWNENGSEPVLKVNSFLYRTKSKDPYWEFKLETKEKLLIREIDEMYHHDSIIRPYFPYHRVNKVLTMDALKKRIAKEMFAGKYKVVYNDTLATDKIVELDDNLGVKGVKVFTKYEIKPDIDIEFSLPNYFSFFNPEERLKAKSKYDYLSKALSFQFSEDTLILKDYEVLTDDGEDDIKLTRPRMKLLRLK